MEDIKITVVGAGLAGCEAAYALAKAGFKVCLREMKPEKYSEAHTYPGFAELVCSNSLKASRLASAAGLLKEEMRRLGSVTLECADKAAVSAGGALAVDREHFSDLVTEKIKTHQNISIKYGEVTEVPEGYVIIATGPLTSKAFADAFGNLCGNEYLSFYDASAPIIDKNTIDFDKVFYAARYDRGEADYINCPFTKEEYDVFYDALVNAKRVELHEFEREYFKVYEGCMPIEVMASRGPDTMRFGPMRPVGIIDPHTGHRPWANIQLRKENEAGDMYNMVGFQTNLTFPEQKRVFSLIPGLKDAGFIRYGVMHRNTFINSPKLLTSCFNLKSDTRLYFAGQLTGVEGYIESAASGIVAARALISHLKGKEMQPLPTDTMLGALCSYISTENEDFQPMGSNMGILPPLGEKIKGKEAKYLAYAERALASLDRYLDENKL